MKLLIVNADDLGLTRGVNEGIIRAHREGILTSATLMATAPAFDDAVARAHATPTLGIGAHLVLTGGVAVAPREEIRSLVDETGRLPKSLGSFVAQVTSGKIRTRDIETELRAQIEKIRRAGIEPSHFDTHKHTHAHPRVMNVLGRVARDVGITRIRKPIENLRDSWNSMRGARSSKQLVASAAVRAISSRFAALCRKYGLRSPDYFLGLAITGHTTAEKLCRFIDALPEGRTEIMVHPGIRDADLAATGSRLQSERQLELESLLVPAARLSVERSGAQLISYRELN